MADIEQAIDKIWKLKSLADKTTAKIILKILENNLRLLEADKIDKGDYTEACLDKYR